MARTVSLSTFVVCLFLGFVVLAPAASADSSISIASGAGLTPPTAGTVRIPSVQVSFDGENWSPAYAADANGYWPTPDPGSNWDVPSPDRNDGYGNPQDLFYRVSFTLPAGFLSPSIAGDLGADDQPVEVSLNGTPIANYAYEGYLYDPSPHPFSSNDASLFQAGTNVVEFETLNLGGVTTVDFAAIVTYLRGSKLQGANLSGADLAGANLHGDNLQGAVLTSANLSDTNLAGDNLQGDSADGANFAGAALQGDNLQNGSFADADFQGDNLSGANLSNANFTGTNLSGANLQGDNLQGDNLTGANLIGANTKGDNLKNIVWSDTTCPDGTNSDQDGGTCVNNTSI